jgi:hypothetical protein
MARSRCASARLRKKSSIKSHTASKWTAKRAAAEAAPKVRSAGGRSILALASSSAMPRKKMAELIA